MSDLSITAVGPIDIYKIRSILSSTEISDNQKAEFLKNNNIEIKSAFKTVMTSEEYTTLMKNRPLQSFKPIKNSFTKRGDKVLLSKAMNIPVSDIDSTIENVANNIDNLGELNLSKNDVNLMQTYVYRHGSKKQVVAFLEQELSETRNVVKKLYQTLKYDTAGVADYFSRPIHYLDNKTLVKIYNVVDDALTKAHAEGDISEMDALKTSEWALKQIYLIQNNSKLRNAIKLHKNLT